MAPAHQRLRTADLLPPHVNLGLICQQQLVFRDGGSQFSRKPLDLARARRGEIVTNRRFGGQCLVQRDFRFLDQAHVIGLRSPSGRCTEADFQAVPLAVQIERPLARAAQGIEHRVEIAGVIALKRNLDGRSPGDREPQLRQCRTESSSDVAHQHVGAGAADMTPHRTEIGDLRQHEEAPGGAMRNQRRQSRERTAPRCGVLHGVRARASHTCPEVASDD